MEQINDVQIQQYDAYLEDLRERGLISMEQMEEMKKAARARKASREGLEQQKANEEAHKPPGPKAKVAPEEKASSKGVRPSTKVEAQQHMDAQSQIESIQTRQYEAFLEYLRAHGFIHATQVEELKRAGLRSPATWEAAEKGCFTGVDQPSVRMEIYYGAYLGELQHRTLIDALLCQKLKRLGLRGLKVKSPTANEAATKMVSPSGVTQETEQDGFQEYPKYVRPSNSTTKPSSSEAKTQSNHAWGGNNNNQALEPAINGEMQTNNGVNPLSVSDKHLHGKYASNHLGAAQLRASNVSKQTHISVSSPGVRDAQRSSATEGLFMGESNENLNTELTQQKPKEQEERMQNWSRREREVAEYKEKKRRAKEMAKLERQIKKERDIVSSAIAAVIAETSNESPSNLEDSSHSTPIPDKANISAPKTNAFSMMMGAQSTANKKGSQWNRSQPPAHFRHYIFAFEKSLESADCHQLGEKAWAKLVQRSITACVQSEIFSKTYHMSNVQTKINALNAILEIATAVAYAKGPVSDRLRSTMPGYLTGCLFLIAESMSETEAQRVLKDEAFVDTLKQLRREPLVEWKDDTWNGLDDVLRVLNDPGPVDFRRIFKKVKEILEEDSHLASSSIIKAIRREVSDYVTHESCFETKYNALNVLADIGLGLLQETFDYPRKDARLVIETLCTALLNVGQKLTVLEIERIVEEFRMDESIPDAGLSNQFDQLLIPDTTQSISDRLHENLRMQKIIEDSILEKSTKKTAAYCENALLMKLYHLRWRSIIMHDHWESSKLSLQTLLEILVDTSAPIQTGEYLQKLNKNFARELAGQVLYDSYGTLRESVDRSIHQISKRSSSRATYESRMNAFKILTKIGLQLVGFLDPTKPFWQTRIFKDQITEDSLTDAMRFICHSLAKEDRTRLLSDKELMEDLNELNYHCVQLPDAMLGLDAVMDMISGVEDLSTSAAISLARKKRKLGDVVDLTDSVSPKRHAISRNPAKVVPMIDLTDD